MAIRLELRGQLYVEDMKKFQDKVNKDVFDYIQQHPQDYTKELSPVEDATVNYLKELIAAASSAKKGREAYEKFWEDLFEKGGFDIDLKKGGQGAFGVFIEDLLGVGIQFPKQVPNAAYPDIPRLKEFNDPQGIEMKTRRANLMKAFHVTVGGITAKGGTIKGDPLTNKDIEEINNLYIGDQTKEAIALDRLINKMANFLYMRVIDKNSQKQLYNPKNLTLGQKSNLSWFFSKISNRAKPKLEVVAFILFMRLIIDHIKAAIKETSPEKVKVIVNTKTKRNKNNLIIQTNYDVSIGREHLIVGEEDYLPLAKLVRELSFIRYIYGAEVDFINKLEMDRWKDARKFYAMIKNKLIRTVKFEKLED